MAHGIVNFEEQRQDHEEDDILPEISAEHDQPCEGWDSYNLLTLDGGGIRGYWSLLVLKRLMECIADVEDQEEPHHHSFRPQPWQVNVSQVKSSTEEENDYDETDESTIGALPKSKRFLPCHYFDYIGGSSTGAFATALMTDTQRQNPEVPYVIRSYKQINGFSPNQSRESTGLASPSKPIRTGTGRTTRTSTGLSNQASTRAPRKSKRKIYNGQHEFRTWQVARAATAAPFFFEPLKLELQTGNYLDFRDGGFGYTNNPTKVGIEEIEGHYGDNSVGVIVSVGTARKDKKPRDTGIFSISSKLRDIASKATDPEKVHNDLEDNTKYHELYYRFNNPGSLDVEMDEWKPKGGLFTKQPTGSTTIKTMEENFAQWIGEGANLDLLRECAEQLVHRRRVRSTDKARWERYATGAEFTCRRKCGSEWCNRDQFKQHLMSAHNVEPDQLDVEIRETRTKWRYQKRRQP